MDRAAEWKGGGEKRWRQVVKWQRKHVCTSPTSGQVDRRYTTCVNWWCVTFCRRAFRLSSSLFACVRLSPHSFISIGFSNGVGFLADSCSRFFLLLNNFPLKRISDFIGWHEQVSKTKVVGDLKKAFSNAARNEIHLPHFLTSQKQHFTHDEIAVHLIDVHLIDTCFIQSVLMRFCAKFLKGFHLKSMHLFKTLFKHAGWTCWQSDTNKYRVPTSTCWKRVWTF